MPKNKESKNKGENEINIDLIQLDKNIKDSFERQKNKLPIYNQELSYITRLLELDYKDEINKENEKGNDFINLDEDKENTFLIQRCHELGNLIHNLAHDIAYNFYLIESHEIITKYQSELNKPVHVSFMENENNQNKNIPKEIFSQFINIVSKFQSLLDFPLPKIDSVKLNHNKCVECGCVCTDVINEREYICINCGNKLTNSLSFKSSYKDLERTNINSKNKYACDVRFLDCIKQYQGKQKTTIKNKIFEDLEERFIFYGLISPDKSIDKKTRFKKVQVEHIHDFLKELGYVKHYDDEILIWSIMTENPTPNITHLENDLIEDFTMFAKEYYTIGDKGERDSFPNYQSVFYQLLRRRGYQCDRRFFQILKTEERLDNTNDIIEKVFNKLGWDFIPIN